MARYRKSERKSLRFLRAPQTSHLMADTDSFLFNNKKNAFRTFSRNHREEDDEEEENQS